MTDDYAYLSARVRGMLGRLLRRPGLEAALGAGSLAELVALLEKTPYAPALTEAMTVTKGIAGVEEGLRRDFQRAIDRLARVAGGRPRRLLAIALGRFEVFNIRTVLRGLHAAVAIEEVVANTVPFGRLDEAALHELARQKDAAAAVELLAQWGIPCAVALRAALPAYRRHGDLHALEIALDRAFFASSLRSLDPGRTDDAVVADCLRREIDVVLLGYAVRAVHHGSPEGAAEEAFVPGGRTLTREVFARLCAARTVPELIDAVPSAAHAAALSGALPRYRELRRASVLEQALRSCLLREMTRLTLRDPLSICPAVGFVWRKASETAALRVVARGKHAGLSREQIEPLLALGA